MSIIDNINSTIIQKVKDLLAQNTETTSTCKYNDGEKELTTTPSDIWRLSIYRPGKSHITLTVSGNLDTAILKTQKYCRENKIIKDCIASAIESMTEDIYEEINDAIANNEMTQDEVAQKYTLDYLTKTIYTMTREHFIDNDTISLTPIPLI